MAASNVERHRAGHEAFNRRHFAAMTSHYADRIRWTDRARDLTFTTPGEFRDEFLAGWVQASSDIRVTDPRYLDAGQTAVATFTVTHDGRWGRSRPPAGRSPWPCASSGTSTRTLGWSAAISTTTRSRCSCSSACCPSRPAPSCKGLERC